MTEPSWQPGRPGVALEHPGTRELLAGFRGHWSKLVRIGLIVMVACGVGLLASLPWLGSGDGEGERDRPNPVAAVVGSLALPGGIAAGIFAAVARGRLRAADRVEWTLGHYPWQTRHRYRFRFTPGAKRHRLLIEADQVGPEARCQINGGSRSGWESGQRLEAAAGHEPLFVAGDPLYWAVAMPADLRDLFVLEPDRFLGRT